MDRERLIQLACLDFSDFIQSENIVKYKIVIPFLQAFDHHDLHLEHAAVEDIRIVRTKAIL